MKIGTKVFLIKQPKYSIGDNYNFLNETIFTVIKSGLSGIVISTEHITKYDNENIPSGQFYELYLDKNDFDCLKSLRDTNIDKLV